MPGKRYFLMLQLSVLYLITISSQPTLLGRECVLVKVVWEMQMLPLASEEGGERRPRFTPKNISISDWKQWVSTPPCVL